MWIEVGSFLAATFVVNRPRPTVPAARRRTADVLVPSGHTAAALVLYVGIAIVVWTLTDNRVLRVFFWTLAVVVPIFVALSRLYRGMHHATDVVASVLLAAGSLVAAIVVTRVSAAATAPARTVATNPPARHRRGA